MTASPFHKETLTMKQLSILACLTLAATAVVAQAQSDPPISSARQAEPATWKRYTVKGEEFSVTLPTHPAMATSATFLTRINEYRKEHTLGACADGVCYIVRLYENPEPRQSLEDLIAQQNRDGRWDLSTERPVTINGFKGKQYSWNKFLAGTVQVYADKGRLYQFDMGGPGVDESVVKQFFSSILLGKNAEAVEVSPGPGFPFPRPAEEIIFTGRDLDSMPRLMTKPQPRYTEDAHKKKIAGTVVLKAVLSSNGSVTNIMALKELPHGLTEQAMHAAKMIIFYPGVKNGKYASMFIQLEYNFSPE
jgi:hypothetical protein